MSKLVLAITGATGALAADILVEKSPWPVSLVASKWGRDVYERECGPLKKLAEKLAKNGGEFFDNDDLAAPISSGSVETIGMVILPCSSNTLGKISSGLSSSLITRAAHCHLKERRRLIICVRETPWSLINLNNASSVAAAGGIIMPMSPPFFMNTESSPKEVSLHDVVASYVDRILSLLGHQPEKTWENVK